MKTNFYKKSGLNIGYFDHEESCSNNQAWWQRPHGVLIIAEIIKRGTDSYCEEYSRIEPSLNNGARYWL